MPSHQRRVFALGGIGVDFVSEIKERLKMGELLQFYGFEIGRNRRIACPFHNGKDKNLSFNDDFWYCFVCNEAGDLISFVRKFFDLSFNDTIIKLNEDFGLGLPVGKKLDPRKELAMGKKWFERKQALKREQAETERIETAYWKAHDEWLRLERQKNEYAPKVNTDPLHPLFVEALQKIDQAYFELQIAEIERYNHEHRNSKNP